MNLLLDTQVVLWWLSGNARLGTRARELVGRPGNTAWVSAVSVLEIAIKSSVGKLAMNEPLADLPHALERHRFRGLSVSAAHALAVGALPWHHKDPFDRVLIAQARLESLTLLTSDSVLTAYDVTIERADA